MRILFLQDNAINESLALTELSSLLKSRGHDCSLLIEREEKMFLEKAKRYSPDIVIIPFGILGHEFPLRISEEIKKRLDIPIVFAGAHPTFYPEIISHPFADIVCIGESENPITELADNISKGKRIDNIRGLWVKEGGRIRRNSIAPLVANLDSLPLPDREIYYRYGFMSSMPMKRFMSGRGCVHNCGYCFNPQLRDEYMKKYRCRYTRKKSVERILEEISVMKERYSLKTVHFSDDLFTYDKRWVIDFCRQYKKEIGIPFTFNSVADQIDREIIRDVSEAGCRGIALGIESGSENIRKAVLNKNITDEQIIKAGSLIKDADIRLSTFNMIANPGETIDDAFRTIRLNQKIKADNPRVTVAHPIMKTRLYEHAKRNGYLNEKEFEEKVSSGGNIKPYTKVFYRSSETDAFENLFYLFRIACRFPGTTGIIRKIIRLPKTRLFEAGLMMSPFGERDFFDIPISDSVRHFIHCGNPFFRTTNYTSII